MTFRSLPWIALSLLTLALSACGTPSAVRNGTAKAVTTTTGTLPPPDLTSSGSVYAGVSEYRLGPKDLIGISVFQVPELTQEVRVNAAGQISLPLIGTVQAGSRTVPELQASIAEKLQEKFLQNPQVIVFVKEYASQRVTMDGAVLKPGIYPLTGRTTLLQCIALAGLSPLADPKGVIIFRQVGGKKMAAVFDINAIRGGDAEDPLIYGDDMIVVDQSGTKTAWKNFTQAIPVFNVFGVY